MPDVPGHCPDCFDPWSQHSQSGCLAALSEPQHDRAAVVCGCVNTGRVNAPPRPVEAPRSP